jgi:DNA polymerase-4
LSQQRIIAHFDLDTFFVSVERLNDPSLMGKPVIVGGSRERGVVSTCSYETRVFGVHSGMPMAQAMKLCPHAIVLQGTRGDYSRYSRWVTEIIAAKAPLFEKASIDEFYIDLTGIAFLILYNGLLIYEKKSLMPLNYPFHSLLLLINW